MHFEQLAADSGDGNSARPPLPERQVQRARGVHLREVAMVDQEELVNLSAHATGHVLGRAARLLLRLAVSLAGLGPRLLRRLCGPRR